MRPAAGLAISPNPRRERGIGMPAVQPILRFLPRSGVIPPVGELADFGQNAGKDWA